MAVDYSALTLQELNEIINQAGAEREKRISARRAELLAELNELEQLSRPKATSIAKAPSRKKAIYRDEHGNVWGGNGRPPQWLKKRIEAGATFEQFIEKN